MARTGKLIGPILHPAGRGPFIGARRRPLSLRERGWGEGQRSTSPVRALDLSRSTLSLPGLTGWSPDSQAWRRSPRRPYFSLLVQRKVGKRNTPRRSARRCAAGAQSRREFSDGASCPGRKRRTSLCAALRVLPAGTAGPKGPQKPARTDPACTPLPWLFGVPMRHGEWVGKNPQGAVIDDGVSVWHRDVPYGNSRPARAPGARSAEGVPSGVCFFASFFAQAKKRSSTA
jgi:hypothetical protein